MNNIINEETLQKILNLSNSTEGNLIKDLLIIFDDETPKRIQEIKKAVLNNQIETVYRAAHTLKSGAAYLGAEKLSKISGDLENMASEGKCPKDIQNIIAKMEEYFIESSKLLHKNIDSQGL